jgi:hypothetical protein
MLAPQEPTVTSEFAPRTTIDADGTVVGYASLFGEIDQARDMVMRGAFSATLAARTVQRIPMLFQHDPPNRSASGSSCARTTAGFTRAAGSFRRSRAPRSCCRWCAPARSTGCRSAFAR